MSAPTPPPSVYCPAIGDRVRYWPGQIGTASSFDGTCDSVPFLVGTRWCVHLREMDPAYRNGERSTVKAAAITSLRPAPAPLVEHEDMGRWAEAAERREREARVASFTEVAAWRDRLSRSGISAAGAWVELPLWLASRIAELRKGLPPVDPVDGEGGSK